MVLWLLQLELRFLKRLQEKRKLFKANGGEFFSPIFIRKSEYKLNNKPSVYRSKSGLSDIIKYIVLSLRNCSCAVNAFWHRHSINVFRRKGTIGFDFYRLSNVYL